MIWIECADKMPVNNQGVVFFCTTHGVDGGWYDERQRAFLQGSGACGCSAADVTHWMPFPEPPEPSRITKVQEEQCTKI